jgi:hypothetical protein
MLALEELTTEELERMLEELATDALERMLDELIPSEELDLELDETAEEIGLDERLLEETGQLAPPTTP